MPLWVTLLVPTSPSRVHNLHIKAHKPSLPVILPIVQQHHNLNIHVKYSKCWRGSGSWFDSNYSGIYGFHNKVFAFGGRYLLQQSKLRTPRQPLLGEKKQWEKKGEDRVHFVQTKIAQFIGRKLKMEIHSKL